MLKIIFVYLPLGVLLYFGFVFLWRKYRPEPKTAATLAPKPGTTPPVVATAITVAVSEPEAETAVALGAHLPQDQVFRRHYLTHLLSMLNAIHPPPSESVLRRHHQQFISSQLDACLLNQAAIETLQQEYEALPKDMT